MILFNAGSYLKDYIDINVHAIKILKNVNLKYIFVSVKTVMVIVNVVDLIIIFVLVKHMPMVNVNFII